MERKRGASASRIVILFLVWFRSPPLLCILFLLVQMKSVEFFLQFARVLSSPNLYPCFLDFPLSPSQATRNCYPELNVLLVSKRSNCVWRWSEDFIQQRKSPISNRDLLKILWCSLWQSSSTIIFCWLHWSSIVLCSFRVCGFGDETQLNIPKFLTPTPKTFDHHKLS